jgi:hypothetical protein
MNDLPNMDSVSDIEEGVEPEQVEPIGSTPHDTTTAARCLIPLLTIPGVVTGDKLQKTKR